jgi:hypothetical protein
MTHILRSNMIFIKVDDIDIEGLIMFLLNSLLVIVELVLFIFMVMKNLLYLCNMDFSRFSN